MISTVKRDRPGNIGKPLSYDLNDTAYSANDQPQQCKEKVAYVKQLIAKDTLKQRPASWNASTLNPREHRFPHPSMKRELSVGTSIRAEIDYRAEVLPKRDPV
jgi:hypothetical protein